MAGVGRVFQGVEYPSRREASQARQREYVRALADGLNFTQAAHAVGVSKRTGKVWRNGGCQSVCVRGLIYKYAVNLSG